MAKEKNKEQSKFLSYVLRHNPGEIGLVLDASGWADVEELVTKSKISLPVLKEIVETDSKKRYSFNEDETKIRANQGHSVTVDLGLSPTQPPDVLYHGTSDRFFASIQNSGLEKRGRQHVHLSKDKETATTVGKRHGGSLIVFEIDAKQMFADGFTFCLSENEVWLTDNVPFKYLFGYATLR